MGLSLTTLSGVRALAGELPAKPAVRTPDPASLGAVVLIH